MQTPAVSNEMGLQNLLNEPIRLSGEADRLNSELEALVMDNYRVFVENLTCSVHLRAEDKKLSEVSSTLETNLHELSQKCQTFKDRVNNFVSAHKRNRKTLQHHMQLIELLEVPQLVDACARNNFYEEALELANFVNGLERRHLLASEVKSMNSNSNNSAINTNSYANTNSTNTMNVTDSNSSTVDNNSGLRSGSSVIQSIVNEVHKTLYGLKSQLLLLFTENLSLPKELSIIATLRKLDSLLIDRYLSVQRHSNSNNTTTSSTDKQRDELKKKLLQNSEMKLQMDFLETRTIWLERTIDAAVNSRNSSNSITNSIHTNENSGSDSVSNSSSSANNTGNSAGNVEHNRGNNLGPYGKVIEMLEVKRTCWFTIITHFQALFEDKLSTDNKNNSSTTVSSVALNGWTTIQVYKLLQELNELLPAIEDGSSLRSVLEQSLFFATRMAQVGADFTDLVLPLFEKIMLNHITSELSKAAENFKIMLSTERIRIDPNDGKEQIIPLYLAQDNNSILDTDLNLNNNNGGLEIPIYLLRYPPIAYLLNSHLSILNYVKDCPLKSIQNKVLLTIESFLNSTCRLILEKAPEIRAKGDKYLGDAYQKKGEKAKTSSSTMTNTDRLDYLYVDAIGRELIPHLLLCYECIYNTRNSKIREQYLSTKYSQRKQTMCNSVGNSNDSNVNTNTTIEFLINNSDDYKDLLSELSLPVMDRLWSLLLSTKMLTTIERKKIAKIPLKKQVVPRYTDTNSATNSTVDGNSAKVVDSSEESAFSFTEKQKQETSPTVKNDFEQSARGKKD